MGRFAPGTMGFDIHNATRSGARRREDIASGLYGAANLFQTLAGINQRMQSQADQQAALPYLQRAYDYDPTGGMAEGAYGPMQPTPMQDAFAAAQNQPEPSFWQNIGTSIGIGQRQGRITPQALAQIGSIEDSRVQQGYTARRDARAETMDAMRIKLIQSQVDRNNRMPAAGGGGAESPTNRQITTDISRDEEDAAQLGAAADRLEAIDQQIAAATDENVRSGLLNQRDDVVKALGGNAVFDVAGLRDMAKKKRGNVKLNYAEGVKRGIFPQPQDPQPQIDEFLKNYHDRQNNPFGVPSAPAGPTRAAAPVPTQGGDEESRLTEGGTDTEMVQAIAAFKAQHPGVPFDPAAFMGWLSSGR